METETLDKIYLEWSQFTLARTPREIKLKQALENLLDVFERCESGYPPEAEVRFLARDWAKAALGA